MSQSNVERLIGRLLTDEALRERFLESPDRTLEAFMAEGWTLTRMEQAALEGLDRQSLTTFARRVDPRIRKASLTEGSVPHEPARPNGANARKAGVEKES